MQNKKLSIRRIVSYLNDQEAEGGGFWLPNIQRPFVWNEDQIVKLFDSIMREYPISTLLVWKTRLPIKHRRFVDNFQYGFKLSLMFVPEHERPKLMVLDGQQRLQSLFIGLRGSYVGKELYFDILSGDGASPEDIRYRFEFKDKKDAVWPWIRFKDIVFQTSKLDLQIAQDLIKLSPESLGTEDTNKIHINVARARQEFVNDDNITYQELDGIDNPDTYQIDDIVEVFIRANSGGTKLGKSDLLFSLLATSWDDADGEMEILLEDLNKGGFEFDRDFVLKSCLTMLGKGARYEVKKFRDGKTKDEIINGWADLSAAIKSVRDLLVSRTYIRSDKAMPSYLALIPLIYFRYHYPKKFSEHSGLAEYILRVLITGAFSGNPDYLIDSVVKSIQETNDFNLSEIYGVIRADNRNLEISSDVILNQAYGSRTIHLFFNLWYRDFDYTPAFNGNGPQVDHIFPQSLLKTVKDPNPETGRLNILRYRAEQRDQIANCMLLKADENGFAGKTDTPPSSWFDRARFKSDDEHKEYLAMHLIPSDTALWQLDRFDDFINARKELILNKFRPMLLVTPGGTI